MKKSKDQVRLTQARGEIKELRQALRAEKSDAKKLRKALRQTFEALPGFLDPDNFLASETDFKKLNRVNDQLEELGV